MLLTCGVHVYGAGPSAVICCEFKARLPTTGGLAAHLHILLYLRRCRRRVQLRQEEATQLLVHAWELQAVVTCAPRAHSCSQQCALVLFHNCALPYKGG